eukprot:gnl/TRDRNA2_/TRDRNA2_183123_c0_seq1.p1 gnl/TRDRNA2_/TRDRNA2_183123_c0~~gnl/TRDRNA2_/TRDRNA2_183123_c0_seq1.p1  ORF type:complete len:158 (+),score=36.39 gnl/TRDRNA2_/TRDRNA2_183123_c0_seq1:84-557(+)
MWGKGGYDWYGKGWGKGPWDWGKGWGKGPWMMFYPKDAKTLVRQCGAAVAPPGGGRWENDDSTLFVGGLPSDTTDLDMYNIFAPFGAIAPRGATAMKDKENASKCTGIGFVNYMEVAHAQHAIQKLNGTMMSDGSTLSVKIKGPSKKDKDKAPAPKA